MNTLLKTLRSRTNQVIAVTFLLNSVQYLTPFISPDLMVLLNGILGSLAVYLKMNPSQIY